MTTSQNFGGCTCGAVRYEFSGDIVIAFKCHCRDCQYASGTGSASLMAVWKDSFQFLSGEPKYHTKFSDRGPSMHRGFCAECGSPLTMLEPHRPKLVFIQAASLDEPSLYQPTMETFTERAHHWDVLNPALELYPGMPPISDDLGR